MNLLIGSRALNFFTPLKLDGNDWDIISDKEIEGAEVHSPELLDNYKLEHYNSGLWFEFNGHKVHVINPTGLCLIKRSHLFRDISFDKHITQYHKLLFKYRAGFTKQDEQFLTDRIRLTSEKYSRGHPKLNKTVAEFFDDDVKKIYNHDDLHKIVAFNEVPMYTKMQPDPKFAWCDKKLWENFSRREKLECVAEETYVISIERFLVPQWKIPPKLAYFKALRKVCTTLCSGWFRDFAIDNYPDILSLFNQEKIERIKCQILNLK